MGEMVLQAFHKTLLEGSPPTPKKGNSRIIIRPRVVEGLQVQRKCVQ